MLLGQLVEVIPSFHWTSGTAHAPSRVLKLSRLSDTKWEIVEDGGKDYSGYPFATMEGDIVISHRASIGEYLIVGPDEIGAVAPRGFAILRSRDLASSNQDWIAAWLQTERFKQQVKSREHSSTLPALSLADLESLEIPQPDAESLKRLKEIELYLVSAEKAVSQTLVNLQKLREIETEILFTEI